MTETIQSTSQETTKPSHDGDAWALENRGKFIFTPELGLEVLVSSMNANVREVESSSPESVLEVALQYPGEIAIEAGFDLEKEFSPRNLPGPIIEVAGPTPGGYGIVRELGTMPEHLYISNLNDYAADNIGPHHYKADATQLPHADESIGAVMVSYIGFHELDTDKVRKDMMAEFMRVLGPNGLVVMQGAKEAEVVRAVSLGYTIEAAQINYAHRTPRGLERLSIATVLRKPAD